MELNKLIGKGARADVYECGSHAVKVFHEDYAKHLVFYEAAVTSLIESAGLPVAAHNRGGASE